MATPICFRLDTQSAVLALARALFRAGNNIAARIPMIAMTTNNSIKVNAFAIPILPCDLTMPLLLYSVYLVWPSFSQLPDYPSGHTQRPPRQTLRHSRYFLYGVVTR